jgi:crossover junction endodeoxyribonuclease RuvC
VPRLRILGIDPGSRVCGYGIVDLANERAGAPPAYVECGVIQPPPGASFVSRLREIAGGLRAVIAELEPDEAAVEQVFFHRSVRDALKLGEARGVALLCAAEAGLAVAEYTPARIKLAVTGRGRAAKEQVQEMVRTILGLRRTPRADAADALAVALCHAYTAAAPVLRRLGPGERGTR